MDLQLASTQKGGGSSLALYRLAWIVLLCLVSVTLLLGCTNGSQPDSTLLPTDTPTPTPSQTPTEAPQPTSKAIPFPTATRPPTAAATPAPTPTNTPALSPTHPPKPTPDPTATSTPTHTPTPTPTNTPTPSPTPTAEETAAARLSEIIPWFENPPEAAYVDIAEVLIDLWLHDADLGNAVARISWVTDQVNEEEAGVLRTLRNIADTSPELAKQVVSYPWLGDYLTYTEPQFIEALRDIASKDIKLARLVAGFPWFADGFGGATGDEWETIHTLDNIASKDIELARLAASLPWLADNVTDNQWGVRALDALDGIAAKDIGVARLAANLPWLADYVTRGEWLALQELSGLSAKSIELARMVVGLPWSEGKVTLTNHALSSLARLAGLGPDVLGQLTAQPWLADGLSEAEIAFVTTLHSIASTRPDLYDELLSVRYTQHKTIPLPLAGDVNIWVIENAPPAEEDLLSVIEETALITEGLLELPFPTTDIILLIVPSPREGISAGGRHYGTHMMMGRDRATVSNLRHEVAHYYFGGPFGPRWLREGAAEFVESYINDHTGGQNLSDRRTDLSMKVQVNCIAGGVENIRHHAYLVEHVYQYLYREDCEYYMGHHFLLNLFETMGGEALVSALRELYLLVEDDWQTAGRGITEDDIYYVFQRHTPTVQMDEFRGLYRRLHGAAAAFPETDFSDDHGDETVVASPIEVGKSVEGMLDYMFDFDFFQFSAAEGQKYRMTVDHESLRSSSVTLYDADGLIQELGGVGSWKSRRRTAYGPEILWIVPSSGKYYFAVQNFGGRTGPYTLTIDPIDDEPDDHGDTLATSTSLSPGEATWGLVDDDFDYDYFRFEAVRDRTYRIDVTGTTLEHFRVRLYASDGAAPTNWHRNRYRDDSSAVDRASIEWTAPSSGEHYLAIDGAFGSIGTYTVKVTLVDKGPVN